MASYRIPSSRDRTPLQRRASGLALALGVNLLLLLALLQLGVIPLPGAKESEAFVVDLLAAPSPAPSSAPRPRVRSRTEAADKPLPPRPRIALPTKPQLAADRPLDIIPMSKEDLAAGDIGRLPRAAAGSRASDSQEVGRAPNGEVLYAAEWAREPTAAELGGYLPKNAPAGSGLIVCKTIPGNRVDDCLEIESRPAGSRLAGAVRQADWQFRVRPPRKNAEELVGSWVRIRIDYIR